MKKIQIRKNINHILYGMSKLKYNSDYIGQTIRNYSGPYGKKLKKYSGNPKYSTMISKLCNFNIRSELILYIITLCLNVMQ